MKFIRTAALLVGATAIVAGATSSMAATIVLNDIGGVRGSPAERGFQTAALFWGRQLTNDVTVNLNIAFGPLRDGVLGSTSSRQFVVGIEGLYGQLADNATSALDASAVASLQPLTNGAVTVVTAGYTDPATRTGIDTTTSVVDSDQSGNNSAVVGTSANLKALGYIGIPDGADATITFSSNYAFDFDPTDGIDDQAYDFTGVAIHEIGHALGFISGVDTYDFYGCPDGPACDDGRGLDFNDYAVAAVSDLFRYSDAAELNWVPGAETYFSIDGGTSELLGNANLSTGRYNGDGFQASHFKANGTCDNFIGIMNPYLCNGTVAEVTAQDLGVFDAIGWQTRFDVLRNPNLVFTSADAYSVPEPATWLQFLVGFFALGGILRLRRSRKAKPLAA